MINDPDRSEFQLERLILFTDAVFAIAITLLALEIKVPELREVHSEAEVWETVLNLTPRFIGFLTAYFVIAIYWIAHHRTFRYVYGYDGKLIWLNMLFLLSIVLMPFTAAFQGEYPLLKAPWVLYCGGVIFTGLMQVALQVYIRNPAHGLTHAVHRGHPDLDLFRPLLTVSVFILSAACILLTDTYWLSRLLLLLMIPLFMFYGRRYRRRLAAHLAARRQAA